MICFRLIGRFIYLGTKAIFIILTNHFNPHFNPHFNSLNNSAFGKLGERLRERLNVVYVSKKRLFDRRVARATFHSATILTNEAALIRFQKTSVLLNRCVCSLFIDCYHTALKQHSLINQPIDWSFSIYSLQPSLRLWLCAWNLQILDGAVLVSWPP